MINNIVFKEISDHVLFSGHVWLYVRINSYGKLPHFLMEEKLLD